MSESYQPDVRFAPKRRYRLKNSPAFSAEKTTPLYIKDGHRTYPRPMEYVNQCVMIVEWWLHRHHCEIDDLMDELNAR